MIGKIHTTLLRKRSWPMRDKATQIVAKIGLTLRKILVGIAFERTIYYKDLIQIILPTTRLFDVSQIVEVLGTTR